MSLRSLTSALAAMTLLCSACAGGDKGDDDPMEGDWKAVSLTDFSGTTEYPTAGSPAAGTYYGELWLTVPSSLEGEMFTYEEYVGEEDGSCVEGYQEGDPVDAIAAPIGAGADDTASSDDSDVYGLVVSDWGWDLVCTVDGDLLVCAELDGVVSISFEADRYSASATSLRGSQSCE